MSWFSSLFSNFKFPPPADSIRPQSQSQSPSQPQIPQSSRLTLTGEETSKQTNTETPSPTPLAASPDPTLTLQEYQAQQEAGRRRNKLIVAAGLAFLGLSVLTTRRSLARRRLASRAPFYKDAPAHHEEQSRQVSGALEAVEALNIATINVLSVAMLLTGGSLWYLDVNTMGDARRLLRGGLGVDGTGKTEAEAEEEIEEFIASVLARKDAKEGRKGKS